MKKTVLVGTVASLLMMACVSAATMNLEKKQIAETIPISSSIKIG